MDLFDLFAKLSLNSEDYEKGLDDAGKKAEGFGSKLKTGLATAGKVAGAAVGLAATGVTVLTKSIVDGTKEVAAYGDEIDKESQKLGISAEAYQEWDAILQHSGSSISKFRGAIKTLNKTFTEARETIGETVAAEAELERQLEDGEISLDEYNQKYDELYDSAYSSMGALSQLGFSMEDISEMSNNTDLALEKVISALQGMPEGADRTAIATELLGRSSMELGALLNTSAEDTEEMRQRVHELGGVMSDEAVKAAAKYQDTLQDMTTAFDGVKRGLITDFMPSVTTVMEGLTELFAGNDEKGLGLINEGVSGFVDNLSKLLPKVIPIIGQFVSSLGTAILDNVDIIMDVGMDLVLQLVSAIVKALPKVAKAAIEIIKKLASSISKNIKPLLKSVVQVIVEIAKTLTDPQSIREIISAGIEMILALVDGLLEAIPILVTAIPEIIQNLIEALLSPDATRQFINAATTLIEALVKGLLECLPQLIAAALQIIIALTEALLDPETNLLLIKSGFDIIIAVIKGIVDAIPQLVEMAPEIIESLKDAIVKAATRLYESAGEMLDKIKQGLKDSWPVIKKWGGELIDKIWEGIKDTWTEVKKWAGKIWEKVKDGTLWEDIKTWGIDTIKKVWSGIVEYWPEVKKWAGKIFGWIKDGASSVWGKVKDIGVDIVKGVWDGISSMGTWLYNKVTGWAGGIVDWAKDALGIHSPSKVFAQIGAYTAEGFENGFDKEFASVAKNVHDQMESLSNQSVDFDTNIASSSNNALAVSLNSLLGILTEIRDKDMTVVLDDGTIVGRIDKALGRTAMRKARGNA